MRSGLFRRFFWVWYLLYFISSMRSGLFRRFFWVWYLLMPGTPLAFCSVHSMVMFTRTCLPFFAMHVTLRRAAATLGVGLATATREPAKDVDAIILLSRRTSNARKHTQRR